MRTPSAVFLLLLTATAHLVVVLFSQSQPRSWILITDGIYILVIACAALLGAQGWWAERRRPDGKSGLGGFALGMLALLLAEAWMLQYDLPGHSQPDLSPADPLYFLSYLGVAHTLLRLNGLRGWSLAAAVNLLDSLTVVIVVGELAWISFLSDSLSQPGISLTLQLVNLTYVALDLLLLGLTLLSLRRRFSPPLLLFGTGMFAFVMADLQYFALSANDRYVAGTPLDTLWAWGTAAQAIGLVWAWQARSWALPAEPHEVVLAARQDRVLIALPYLAMAVGSALLIQSVSQPQLQSKRTESWSVMLFVVVMLRQMFSSWERERLNRTLMCQARELHHRAFHDALTGLSNRAAFERELYRRLRQPLRQPLALLYLDLNNFKPVNDTLGHAAGDLALQQVAARLRSALPPDTFVARLGGDEFTILLDPVQSRAEAREVCRQLQQALEAPMQLGPATISLSAAVGVVLAPAQRAVSAEALWQEADQEMYQVKRGEPFLSLSGGPDSN